MKKFSSKLKTVAIVLAALAAVPASQAVFGADAPKPAAAVDESGDPSPFPPGPNAMVTQTFDEKTARKLYQKMMGESPDTERGKKIVTYLSTVLGEKE